MGDRFQYGAEWLRADFHLHTNADREFTYSDDPDHYYSNYVSKLEAEGIGLGVITNHNKFDHGEFKALKKTAKRKGIFLLPGVELSINDGSNGIHVLVVFGDAWIENGENRIESFIASMFPGKSKSEYQRENGRSDKNIISTVKALEDCKKDYFLIFAHVEQRNGLWEEMGGGKLQDFTSSTYKTVRERTLGFQKVRTRDDREKVKTLLSDWYPAEVEGSDCKSIRDIGKGESIFLKLGTFDFDAVKFALTDYLSRISSTPPVHRHSHIRHISFEGGKLGGTHLHFNPELNTLIGIRGSGKSSILECIRTALDIELEGNSGDGRYKRDLVDFTLGSGGVVNIDARDINGTDYTIRYIHSQGQGSKLLMDGKECPGVNIRETVLRSPIYFGQKDLSGTGASFETELVEKLLGNRLDAVREEIKAQKDKVIQTVDRFSRMDDIEEQIQIQHNQIQDADHQLNFYKTHGIDQKLEKQAGFETDLSKMKKGIQLADDFTKALQGVLAEYEDDIKNFKGYASKHNPEIFDRFYGVYDGFLSAVDQVSTLSHQLETAKSELESSQQRLEKEKIQQTEHFAATQRALEEELRSAGVNSLNAATFLKLKGQKHNSQRLLTELEGKQNKKDEFHSQVIHELDHLESLWQKEFELIQQEVKRIGRHTDAIRIHCEYKGDSDTYLEFMKSMFKGSGIHSTTFGTIANHYPDFIHVYKNIEQARAHFGSRPHIFEERFTALLKDVLPYQSPNRFTIQYRGKNLQQHSLGQRASALILFVLSLGENDVIIIDQPEDDLDNQTIYEDLIKLIREIKPNVQFIFATHNPNIPVLGDADQIHACAFTEDHISVASGSIDNKKSQKKVVDIMEGGKEAFARRKEIYQVWKS